MAATCKRWECIACSSCNPSTLWTISHVETCTRRLYSFKFPKAAAVHGFHLAGRTSLTAQIKNAMRILAESSCSIARNICLLYY